jgi:hypothetical protein
MDKFVSKALLAMLAALVLAGCATMPQVAKGSTNYLQTGMASPRLRGNEFYMAIGEVDLYKYGFFGNLKPSGKTVEIAVVIQADKDSGQALKIATMQTNSERSESGTDYENGVAVANGSPYVLSDLRGGMSVIDVQPFPRWLDAIDAMRGAIAKLSTYTNFAVTDRDQLAPVVAVDIGWRWGFWGWGPGWRGPGWGRGYHRWR